MCERVFQPIYIYVYFHGYKMLRFLVPTILVGAGLGVGVSVLLFVVGCIIKHVINKPKPTEVVSIKYNQERKIKFIK